MLPERHRQPYRTFQQLLASLEERVSQSGHDRLTLKPEILQLQIFFQDEIKALNLEELEAKAAQRSQSLQVEMDKQLRLLNMDAMFLQTAKQSTTGGQRRNQIRDRLKTLSQYCEALLQD